MSNYKRRRMFDGNALDTPIVDPSPDLFESLRNLGYVAKDAEYASWREQEIQRGRREKIGLLMQALGVEGRGSYELAMALAEKFVPGFQVANTPKRFEGRPQKWDELRFLEVFIDIERTRLREGLPYGSDVSKLLDIHLQIPPAASAQERELVRDKRGFSTLRNNYARARNPAINVQCTGYDLIDDTERQRRLEMMEQFARRMRGSRGE